MDLLEAVSRSREGDREAMHYLFRTFYNEVYRVAFLITRQAQLAEEATQESFIKAFTRLGGLKEAEKFPSWLRTIAARCALDVLRQERNYRPYADPTCLEDWNRDAAAGPRFLLPQEAGERAETRALVRQALAALEPAYRQVIVLRYYCELDLKEIAAALDCPLGTVKSRLHRGMKALEKALGGEPAGL
ncbi:MAG: sigma-70 family RNA polymerase sigma factor [Clostridia bacterium]|jgi:RNA polymerase sigma-70 factor (ECF subfamily)|nr:sigma-70 family RNA polymerase sigma factor [Clostridia bacterium]MDH7572589.1 sigma-70 family RNA polymerase sigma factor [Clostridia bacterium]